MSAFAWASVVWLYLRRASLSSATIVIGMLLAPAGLAQTIPYENPWDNLPPLITEWPPATNGLTDHPLSENPLADRRIDTMSAAEATYVLHQIIDHNLRTLERLDEMASDPYGPGTELACLSLILGTGPDKRNQIENLLNELVAQIVKRIEEGLDSSLDRYPGGTAAEAVANYILRVNELTPEETCIQLFPEDNETRTVSSTTRAEAAAATAAAPPLEPPISALPEYASPIEEMSLFEARFFLEKIITNNIRAFERYSETGRCRLLRLFTRAREMRDVEELLIALIAQIQLRDRRAGREAVEEVREYHRRLWEILGEADCTPADEWEERRRRAESEETRVSIQLPERCVGTTYALETGDNLRPTLSARWNPPDNDLNERLMYLIDLNKRLMHVYESLGAPREEEGSGDKGAGQKPPETTLSDGSDLKPSAEEPASRRMEPREASSNAVSSMPKLEDTKPPSEDTQPAGAGALSLERDNVQRKQVPVASVPETADEPRDVPTQTTLTEATPEEATPEEATPEEETPRTSVPVAETPADEPRDTPFEEETDLGLVKAVAEIVTLAVIDVQTGEKVTKAGVKLLPNAPPLPGSKVVEASSDGAETFDDAAFFEADAEGGFTDEEGEIILASLTTPVGNEPPEVETPEQAKLKKEEAERRKQVETGANKLRKLRDGHKLSQEGEDKKTEFKEEAREKWLRNVELQGKIDDRGHPDKLKPEDLEGQDPEFVKELKEITKNGGGSCCGYGEKVRREEYELQDKFKSKYDREAQEKIDEIIDEEMSRDPKKKAELEKQKKALKEAEAKLKETEDATKALEQKIKEAKKKKQEQQKQPDPGRIDASDEPPDDMETADSQGQVSLERLIDNGADATRRVSLPIDTEPKDPFVAAAKNAAAFAEMIRDEVVASVATNAFAIGEQTIVQFAVPRGQTDQVKERIESNDWVSWFKPDPCWSKQEFEVDQD